MNTIWSLGWQVVSTEYDYTGWKLGTLVTNYLTVNIFFLEYLLRISSSQRTCCMFWIFTVIRIGSWRERVNKVLILIISFKLISSRTGEKWNEIYLLEGIFWMLLASTFLDITVNSTDRLSARITTCPINDHKQDMTITQSNTLTICICSLANRNKIVLVTSKMERA